MFDPTLVLAFDREEFEDYLLKTGKEPWTLTAEEIRSFFTVEGVERKRKLEHYVFIHAVKSDLLLLYRLLNKFKEQPALEQVRRISDNNSTLEQVKEAETELLEFLGI